MIRPYLIPAPAFIGLLGFIRMSPHLKIFSFQRKKNAVCTRKKREIFSFVRENFSFVRESFSLLREIFSLLLEICHSYENYSRLYENNSRLYEK